MKDPIRTSRESHNARKETGDREKRERERERERDSILENHK